MAHNDSDLRGYELAPHARARLIDGFRLETFRLACDPKGPRFTGGVWDRLRASLQSDAQIEGEPLSMTVLCRDYMHVAYVRELLEHIDCLTAELETIDAGVHALSDEHGEDVG